MADTEEVKVEIQPTAEQSAAVLISQVSKIVMEVVKEEEKEKEQVEKKETTPFFLPNARDIEYFIWFAGIWGFLFIAGICTGAGIFVEVNESYGLHIFAASVALFVTSIRWGLYGFSKRQFLLKKANEKTRESESSTTIVEKEDNNSISNPEYAHWMYDWIKSTFLYKYVNIESIIRKSIQEQYYFGKIHPWLITIWDDLLLLILAVTLSFEYEKSRYWSDSYGPAALSGASMYVFSNFMTSIITGFFLYTPIEENAFLSFWGLRKAFCNFWVIVSTETWSKRDLPSPDKHAAVTFMDIPAAQLLDTFRKMKYIASWCCSLTAFGLYLNRVNDWAWVAGIGLSLAAVGLWLHAHILAWILYYKTYSAFTICDDYVNIYPLQKVPEKKETWTLRNSFGKIAHLWNPDPVLVFFLFLFIVIPYGVPLLVEQPVSEHWARYLYVSTVAVLAYWIMSFGAWLITYSKCIKLHENIKKHMNPFRMYLPWIMIVWENNFLMWITLARMRRGELLSKHPTVVEQAGFKLVEKWRIANYTVSILSTLSYIPLFVYYGVDATIAEYLAPAICFLVSAVLFLAYALQAEWWIHNKISKDMDDGKDIVFPYKKNAAGKIQLDEGHFTWFYSLFEVFIIGVVLAYNVYVWTPFNVSQWVAWSALMVTGYHQVVKTIMWIACKLPNPFPRFWWVLIYPCYTFWIPFFRLFKQCYDATKDTEEEKAAKEAKRIKREADKLAAEQAKLVKMQEEIAKKLNKTTTVVVVNAEEKASEVKPEVKPEVVVSEEKVAESV